MKQRKLLHRAGHRYSVNGEEGLPPYDYIQDIYQMRLFCIPDFR